MERLKNPKTVVALLVTLLAAIVFAQNRQPVTLMVLGIAKVETTLAVALCASFLVGAVIGALLLGRWLSKQQKTRHENGVL